MLYIHVHIFILDVCTDYLNLIKLITAVLNRIAVASWVVGRAQSFVVGKFMFTGKRPVTDVLLNTKYERNPSIRLGASEAYIRA
jgi:hypothetical protein